MEFPGARISIRLSSDCPTDATNDLSSPVCGGVVPANDHPDQSVRVSTAGADFAGCLVGVRALKLKPP